MEWSVHVNGTRADNQYEDTFMEAELTARIKYGLNAVLEIKAIEPVEEFDDAEEIF